MRYEKMKLENAFLVEIVGLALFTKHRMVEKTFLKEYKKRVKTDNNPACYDIHCQPNKC